MSNSFQRGGRGESSDSTYGRDRGTGASGGDSCSSEEAQESQDSLSNSTTGSQSTEEEPQDTCTYTATGDNVPGPDATRAAVPAGRRLRLLPDVREELHQPLFQQGTTVLAQEHSGALQIRNAPACVADYLQHLATHRQRVSRSYQDLCSRILAMHSDRTLHVSYYRCGDRAEFESIVRILDRESVRTKSTPTKYRDQLFYAASYHHSDTGTAPHIHLVHSCLWYNYGCKCALLSALKPWRVGGGYARTFASLSAEDLCRIAVYHLAGGKVELVCQVASEQWTLAHKTGDLRLERDINDSIEGLVETCGVSLCGVRSRKRTACEVGDGTGAATEEPMGGQRPEPGTSSGSRDVNGVPPVPSFNELFKLSERNVPNKRRRAVSTTLEQLVTLFKSRPHCPIESILYSSDYVHDERFVHLNLSGTTVDTAFRQFKLHINELELSELWEMSRQPGFTPAYEAPSSGHLSGYYHSFNESVKMLCELLLFQCDCDLDRVQAFLSSVYSLLNKQLGKCNTILIYGPASSGKNFFVDPVTAFCINMGKIENPSRLNNFAFMHAHNRRVLKWDEASLDPFFCDQVLNLMQGKSFLAQIKFKAPCMIHKTPLFVMANHNPFPNETRFNQRYIGYRWATCPLLAKYKDKQPYPLAAAALVLWSVRHKSIDFLKIKSIMEEVRHNILFPNM